MTVSSAIHVLAGTVVLIGLIGAHIAGQANLLQPTWLWLCAFAGLNVFQMGFTGFCPAGIVFRKLGLKDASA